jgi:dihydroorotate dehydrogenase
VLDFARAGASVVQLYTAFAFQGVGIARNLKDEVIEKLKNEGKTWKQLVASG